MEEGREICTETRAKGVDDMAAGSREEARVAVGELDPLMYSPELTAQKHQLM